MGDLLFWLLVVIGIIVGSLLLITAVGVFLARAHQVTRRLTLKQTPEAVWQAITDYASTPSWHSEIVKVERLPDKNGHEVWRETYRGNYGLILETTAAAAPTRLVRTIADEGGPFRGRWEFALTPDETGCKLTITEFGDVPNPFFRVMMRLYMKPEQYVEMYLTALAKKFGETAVIEK